MKRTVGVHFGHDAGIAVVSERGIEKFLSKERLSRVKHASGWDFETLRGVLTSARPAAIGVSVTQGGDKRHKGIGLIVDGQDGFSIQSTSRRFEEGWAFEGADKVITSDPFLAWTKTAAPQQQYKFSFSDDWNPTIKQRGNLRFTSGLRTLEKLKSQNKELIPKYFDFYENPALGTDEGLVKIRGEAFDAHLFMHHLAHAYYGFWASGLDQALVISQDGGHTENWDGGGYFLCSREKGVLPLVPGGFWMGYFYGQVAKGLGVADSGKLMGLAPYGQAKFFMPDLVGTIGDVESRLGFEHAIIHDIWLKTILGAEPTGANNPCRWDTYARAAPQIVADIAASAQKILEENILAGVETGLSLVRALDKPIDGIIFVGGVALNCPANTLVHQKYPDLKVFVPPACNDEGLAIGNAIGAYFRIYGEFPPTPVDEYDGVYLGRLYADADVRAAVESLEKVADYTPERVARLLQSGSIIGLFHGRSEIGPRALGHRSILASPLIAENWPKVNAVKDREPWRPFAPICLAEDMEEHFTGSDMKSRFMLFTHQVKHSKIPAITHADSSARAQAATASCGLAFDILTAFKALTGYGVLMNTSFNGKGVPIVETPQEAVAEARRIGLDYFVCAVGVYATKSA